MTTSLLSDDPIILFSILAATTTLLFVVALPENQTRSLGQTGTLNGVAVAPGMRLSCHLHQALVRPETHPSRLRLIVERTATEDLRKEGAARRAS